MNAVTPPDLMRKMGKKIEQRKAMQLTSAEVAMLAESGALGLVLMAAADDGTDPVRPLTCSHCDPFIYFLQAARGGPVKIGMTTRPRDRRTAHQQSSPWDVSFIALFHAPAQFERTLHQFYLAEHLRGEWFHPSPRLLRYAGSMGIVAS